MTAVAVVGAGRLGSRHLHAIRQLERVDASGQFGLGRALAGVFAIEPAQQIELAALPAATQRRIAREVVDRHALRPGLRSSGRRTKKGTGEKG